MRIMYYLDWSSFLTTFSLSHSLVDTLCSDTSSQLRYLLVSCCVFVIKMDFDSLLIVIRLFLFELKTAYTRI